MIVRIRVFRLILIRTILLDKVRTFGLDNLQKSQKENMDSSMIITSSRLLEKEASAKSRLALRKPLDRSMLSRS